MRISDGSSDVCSSDLYDLGGGAIAFQPLAGIDDPATRSWAADWLEGLLAHEGIEPDPGIKDALWSALGRLASAPACERTLSGLCALLQENRLRQALAPYVLGGPHGRLPDAECESLGGGEGGGCEMAKRVPAGGWGRRGN